MEKDRVVFYSANDMTKGNYLSMAETKLRELNFSKAYDDVNDIIEMFHIKQYIDADLYLQKWTEDDKTLFKSTGTLEHTTYFPQSERLLLNSSSRKVISMVSSSMISIR